MSSSPRPLATDPRSAGPILGGEAWVVPHEPGGPVWVTASAPEIRVLDRRPKVAPAPAELVAAR